MPGDVWEYEGYYLAQRRSNGKWEIRRNIPGRSRNGAFRKSTGVRDYEEAKRELVKYVLKEAAFENKPPESMPLEELLRSYMEQAEFKEHSSYRFGCRALEDIMTAVPDTTVASIERLSVQRELVGGLRNLDISDSTITRKINALRGALKWAAAEEKISRRISLASRKTLRLAKDGEREAVFTAETSAAFLHACETENLAAFFMFGMNTGARFEAICRVTMDDVDLDRGLIDLRRFTDPSEGKRHGVVRVTDAVRPWLVDRGGYVVGRQESAIVKAWNATVKRARLEGLGLIRHSMRHTVSSIMTNAGVGDTETKLWFAQKVGKEGYTHRLTHRPDYLAAATAALDGFMGEIEVALKAKGTGLTYRSLSPETWRCVATT
ncbi:MAG: tyrosine-type recombinase/integrase [Rhizobiales bacterium]|nr:tyrosine-type recombinase/integrase [Hyphomicrobiales bacterium]